MTSKRFHKLFYSEMAKLMKGHPQAGQVLKHTMTCRPQFDKIVGGDYQGAWTNVRRAFINMPYNRDCGVPEK